MGRVAQELQAKAISAMPIARRRLCVPVVISFLARRPPNSSGMRAVKKAAACVVIFKCI
jgi:hypothetical protein